MLRLPHGHPAGPLREAARRLAGVPWRIWAGPDSDPGLADALLTAGATELHADPAPTTCPSAPSSCPADRLIGFCIYLTRAARGHNCGDLLIAAAADYAAGQGASAVEGYPVTDASTGRRSQLSSGTVGMFARAGFSRPARPAGRRVVMRRQVTPGG